MSTRMGHQGRRHGVSISRFQVHKSITIAKNLAIKFFDFEVHSREKFYDSHTMIQSCRFGYGIKSNALPKIIIVLQFCFNFKATRGFRPKLAFAYLC